MRKIAAIRIGINPQHHAKTRSLERQRIIYRRRHFANFRFTGQRIAIAIKNAHLIFLRKPPGNELFEQRIEGVDAQQCALKTPILKNGGVNIEPPPLAGEVSVGV